MAVGLEGGSILFSNYVFIKRNVRTLDISILPAINPVGCFSTRDLQLCPKQDTKKWKTTQPVGRRDVFLSVSSFLELILSACLLTYRHKRIVFGEDKFTWLRFVKMRNKSVSQIEVTLRLCKTCFAKLIFTDSRFAHFVSFFFTPRPQLQVLLIMSPFFPYTRRR